MRPAVKEIPGLKAPERSGIMIAEGGSCLATVTEIRETRGVVRVTFDGREALAVRARHFQMCPLKIGDALDPARYIGRVAPLQLADAYEAALESLEFRARTEKELERSLLEKGFVAPAVEKTLARLRENRLLDDRRYAERTVERSAEKPVGVYALKQKLRAKGISEEDAEEALSLLDSDQQSDAAKRAARQLARKYEKLPPREAKAKLSQALARRGFPWDAIREAVESALGDGEIDE
jgi:SOS response regulatory protein OraA/RecX